MARGSRRWRSARCLRSKRNSYWSLAGRLRPVGANFKPERRSNRFAGARRGNLVISDARHGIDRLTPGEVSLCPAGIRVKGCIGVLPAGKRLRVFASSRLRVFASSRLRVFASSRLRVFAFDDDHFGERRADTLGGHGAAAARNLSLLDDLFHNSFAKFVALHRMAEIQQPVRPFGVIDHRRFPHTTITCASVAPIFTPCGSARLRASADIACSEILATNPRRSTIARYAEFLVV